MISSAVATARGARSPKMSTQVLAKEVDRQVGVATAGQRRTSIFLGLLLLVALAGLSGLVVWSQLVQRRDRPPPHRPRQAAAQRSAPQGHRGPPRHAAPGQQELRAQPLRSEPQGHLHALGRRAGLLHRVRRAAQRARHQRPLRGRRQEARRHRGRPGERGARRRELRRRRHARAPGLPGDGRQHAHARRGHHQHLGQGRHGPHPGHPAGAVEPRRRRRALPDRLPRPAHGHVQPLGHLPRRARRAHHRGQRPPRRLRRRLADRSTTRPPPTAPAAAPSSTARATSSPSTPAATWRATRRRCPAARPRWSRPPRTSSACGSTCSTPSCGNPPGERSPTPPCSPTPCAACCGPSRR